LRYVVYTLAHRARFGVVPISERVLMGWQRSLPTRRLVLMALASWLSVPLWRHQNIARSLTSLASWHLDGPRCREIVGSWISVAGFAWNFLPPLPMVAIVAAGHNTGLQPAAFVSGGVLPRRHPWLPFHCTAAAGRGIMMGVSVVGWAAAETKRWPDDARLRQEFRP
jgi:hypothetical protein